MEGQGQHRTNGALRYSAHTLPHTLSLAFCSVLRGTMPGECGVQVGQEAPVSAMALDDTCASLKTRDGHTKIEQAANSTSQSQKHEIAWEGTLEIPGNRYAQSSREQEPRQGGARQSL